MILTSTLNAELARLDSIASAAQRQRFACLSRCDYAGARRAYECVKSTLRKKRALIVGELFPDTDES